METAGFEPLVRGFYLEGLLVEADDVWFTDVAVGGVRRLGSDAVLLEDRTMIGGLAMNSDGSLLVSGADGIVWVNPVTGASGTLLGGLAGVNEIQADGLGGLYFGVIDLPAILRGDRPGPSSIHHLSADRTLTLCWEGLAFANGLAVSADASTLYFNESFSAVLAFPRSAGGRLGTPRSLAAKPDCDGLALDSAGNVWITGFASDHLVCLDPSGREVACLALPGAACTNVRFGGPDMRDLYVNLVDPAAAQALAQGRKIETRNSVLFRTRTAVAGAPITRTGFTLD